MIRRYRRDHDGWIYDRQEEQYLHKGVVGFNPQVKNLFLPKNRPYITTDKNGDLFVNIASGRDIIVPLDDLEDHLKEELKLPNTSLLNVEAAIIRAEYEMELYFGQTTFVVIGGILCMSCKQIFSLSVRDLRAFRSGDFRCPNCQQLYIATPSKLDKPYEERK